MHLSNNAKERTTILPVEDECLLHDMLEETLIEAGFAVQSAASGEEAAPRDADAVGACHGINLGRARMDGWELARLVRHHDPDCGILYVSGDSTHRWAANGVPNSMLLPKPFAGRPGQGGIEPAELHARQKRNAPPRVCA
jgi:DNA-binding response OmpR family regulator